MRFAYLKYRLKKLGCYLLIIILLPYIITVFLSGPGAYGASRVDETMVNVKADGEKSGSDGGKQEDSNAENVDKIQMPLSEYCIGIMAREIPAVYEEEALKTQAVLVRTQGMSGAWRRGRYYIRREILDKERYAGFLGSRSIFQVL